MSDFGQEAKDRYWRTYDIPWVRFALDQRGQKVLRRRSE